MLYLVGLGLADESDITVRGLEVVKKAARVYLEAYTSILLVDKETLVRTPCLSPSFSFTETLAMTDKFNGQLVGSFLWTTCDSCRSRIGRNRQRRDP